MRVKSSSLVILSVAQVPAREQAFGDKEHLTVDIRQTCASMHHCHDCYHSYFLVIFSSSYLLRIIVIFSSPPMSSHVLPFFIIFFSYLLFPLLFRFSEEQRQLTDDGLTELRASAAAKFAENGAALDALSAASAASAENLKEVSEPR